jgi:hypothetical protein
VFVPVAMALLGARAWGIMAMLGAALDPENRDAGVAAFDTWFTHGGACLNDMTPRPGACMRTGGTFSSSLPRSRKWS